MMQYATSGWDFWESQEDDDEAEIQIVFTDVLFAVVAQLVVTIYLWMRFINPPAKTDTPEQKAIYAVMTWDHAFADKGDEREKPGLSESDIDFWARLNRADGRRAEILGYRTPDRKTPALMLNQDDYGFQPSSPESDENEEIITSRGTVAVDGFYVFNAHAYGFKGETPPVRTRIKVVLNKGRPGEVTVCEMEVDLTSSGQELTGCHFQIESGALVKGSNKPIVNIPVVP